MGLSRGTSGWQRVRDFGASRDAGGDVCFWIASGDQSGLFNFFGPLAKSAAPIMLEKDLPTLFIKRTISSVLRRAGYEVRHVRPPAEEPINVLIDEPEWVNDIIARVAPFTM